MPARGVAASERRESLVDLAKDVGRLIGEMDGSRLWRENMEKNVGLAHDEFNKKLDELHDCVERRVEESHDKLTEQIGAIGKTVDRLDKTVTPLAADNVQHKWNVERRRKFLMRMLAWTATTLGIALAGLLTALFTGWLQRWGYKL